MNNKFAERLKELRIKNNLTRKQLAEIFNVSVSTINAWETKKSEPNVERLLEITGFFKVRVDYMLGAIN